MTTGDPDFPLLGRIVRPADYVRVLATPMRLRSPHFAVHHLEGRPLPPKKPAARAVATAAGDGSAVGPQTALESGRAPVTASLSTELSTADAELAGVHVDDSPSEAGEYPEAAPPSAALQRWLGLVVPKKHAKRAVTRTLMKRQIRNVVLACAPRLAPGLWVVRQRSPFEPRQFPSAASEALKLAVRDELRALLERAARGERDVLKPRGASAGARAGKPRPAAPPPPPSPEGTPCAA